MQVDPNDPALLNPVKFIGRELTPEQAAAIQAEGHVVRPDGHGRLRRVVGSPKPIAIVELPVIKALVEKGMLVIAAGGGGAPVYEHPALGWEGLDAVVDKDLAAAVLARDVGAELLMILTDVDAVYADWGTPQQRALGKLSVDDAARMDAEKAFGEGSMAPKVRAAIDFVRRTKGRAIITSLRYGLQALRGTAGTTITATAETE